MQIDNKCSDMESVAFGVPQGSILGSVIFNMYVLDLQSYVQCKCHQYADDTTLYQHTKVSQLEEAVADMNANIEHLGHFSDDSNLAVNKSKTKWMLVSTPQMDRVHSLNKKPLSLVYNGSTLERLKVAKLLGVHLDSHLTWNEHITKPLSPCYSTLAVLRKVHYIAPFPIRNQLVECLIFTKLDYCRVVVSPLPDYQLKRLRRIQNACAAFVLGKYCSAKEVSNLGWLPIYERSIIF